MVGLTEEHVEGVDGLGGNGQVLEFVAHALEGSTRPSVRKRKLTSRQR